MLVVSLGIGALALSWRHIAVKDTPMPGSAFQSARGKRISLEIAVVGFSISASSVLLFFPWTSPTDFDISGFIFLLENGLGFLFAGLLLLGAFLSLSFLGDFLVKNQ